MPASNSKDVSVCMVKRSATPIVVTPTDASKARPSVVLTSDTTGLVEGMLIKLSDDSTGLSEIDGKWFIIENVVTDTSFELGGSDTSASTGTFAAGGPINAYPENQMDCLCLSSIEFNPESPEVLSVGTFCEPSASISSASTSAGTVDIAGYVDTTSPDYSAILDWYTDGLPRTVRIKLPNNGAILFDCVLNSINWDVPLDGAISWSGTATLNAHPIHRY